MSHLNIGLSSFGNAKVPVWQENTPRKINLDLRILARAVLSALNLKRSNITAEQTGQLVVDSQCKTTAQDTTRGCIDRVSEAEYRHLVELGHWHHRRQRRRARLR